VLGSIEQLAEPVEALLRIDPGGQTHHREGRSARDGQQLGLVATRCEALDDQRRRRAAVVGQRGFEPLGRVLDRLRRADRAPRVRLDEQWIIAAGVVVRRDLTERKAVRAEHQEHVGAPQQTKLGKRFVPLERDLGRVAVAIAITITVAITIANGLARAGRTGIRAIARGIGFAGGQRER
jgi:hypothetical protein